MTASSAPASSVDEGWHLLEAGRRTDALAYAERLVGRYPASIAALQLQAESALACGRNALAERVSESIVRLDSQLPSGWIVLARARLAAGFPGAAAGAARNALALPGATAIVLGNAGAVLSAAGDHQGALNCFASAVDLARDDLRHRFNLAMQRRYLGDIAAAESDCDAIIAKNPDHFEGWLIRSGLREQSADDNHVNDLRARLARGVGDWRGEGQLLYALAKELDDLGEYEHAFTALARGARLRRSRIDYDVKRDLDMIEALIGGFGASDQGLVEGSGQSEAIFVVGLPRTGTTLAERILSSHSRVESLGEPSAFPAAMMAGMQALDLPVRNAAERVGVALRMPSEALAKGYFDRLQGLRTGPGPFVDKLPMNFLNIGLIRRALPGARIIHVTRNPMDAGYAMFKTWFADAYPFSYDQVELGHYIAAYRRLMDHWKSVYPGTILEIAYEDLVSDVEGNARRMLGHCGLEWEAACASPHRNAKPSTTASATQVRQPTHTRSVGAWQRYSRELEPLRASLEQAGLA